MSTNYYQHCILGVFFDYENLTVVDSKAIYKEEARYNPNTGKETHKEKILVKQEESHYELMGIKENDFYELTKKIESEYGLTCIEDHENKTLYIGFAPVQLTDCGRAYLLNGDVSFEWLVESKNKLEKIFPEEHIELHFFTYIG